jgi:hypothetical protein
MRPLLSVISYNRRVETLATLRSLQATGAFDEAEVVVWDNGSVDGTADVLRGLVTEGLLPADRVTLSRENVGCPRALNAILHAWRRPGQHYIKVDNEVVLETEGWVARLVAFLEQHPDVALASPWYDELTDERRHGRTMAAHDRWLEVFPVVGHCVIHRGSFLDRAGYFDVLAPDHLYGFEDLLMAHRASVMRYKCVVARGVRLRNVQRHSSLCTREHTGEGLQEHVARLRPAYNRRVAQIGMLRDRYRVGPDGQRW